MILGSIVCGGVVALVIALIVGAMTSNVLPSDNWEREHG